MSSAPQRHAVRVGRGLRVRDNWVQLGRFALVGATGYVVNLAVFVLCVDVLGVVYTVAAVIAFLAAVANNFALNRQWTFRGSSSRIGPQALRFLSVSLGVFVVTWGLLHVLVASGTSTTVAQAISVACGTPLNFLLNRLWTFSLRSGPGPGA